MKQSDITAILESNPSSIVIIDKETRQIVYVNNAAAGMIGKSIEEITDKICHHFICPADVNRCPVCDLGQLVDRSERVLLRDGKPVPIIKTVIPIIVGGRESLLESMVDISEQKITEEKLRKSEERYRAIFENTGNASLLIDENTIILLANSNFEKLSGYSKEELEGKISWTVFADGEDLARMQRYHETRRNGGGTVPDAYEFGFIHRDGTKKDVFVTVGTVPETGESIASLMDITERRKTEEALKKSEKYYKAITESSYDILFIVDDAGFIKFATPSVAWILGYSPDELLGKGAFALIVPEDRGRALDDFRRALSTKDEPIFNRFHIGKKDGSVIILEGTGRNLLHDPVIAGFVMTVRDVTKSDWAIEALKESEKKFRSIVDNAFDCILIIDLQGAIRFANNSALQTIKADAEYMIGRDVLEFIAPESVDDVFRDFAEVANGHDTYLAQYYLITRDKEKICVESIGKLIDYEGQPATIVSIRNVTERKKAEEEKENLHGQLLQAQKMESVGRLAGGVAHDFNNMLGVIRGHAEIALLKMEADDPVRANIGQIIEASERSANLTRQLLAFARKQTISPKVLELNDLVSGMLKLLRRLIGEDIALAWMPGSKVWPVKVDPSQIDQILANLCVNARDAIDDVGQITIETKNIHLDDSFCFSHAGCAPGDYVALSVSDNGCGMDQEVLSKIFEPFFTTKGLGKGTGLGLSTVYGIVKQNEGFINADSEPGKGTTFSIYLPRHMGKIDQGDKGAAQRAAVGGDETVLIVEDEPILLDLMKIMLEAKGFKVLTAGTPKEAIRLAKDYAGRIRLLLTDVVMPEMNGRELSNELQSRYPDLKCLYMSGYTADVIAHHGVLDEGVHFIQKPVSMTDLAVKVREVLDSK